MLAARVLAACTAKEADTALVWTRGAALLQVVCTARGAAMVLVVCVRGALGALEVCAAPAAAAAAVCAASAAWSAWVRRGHSVQRTRNLVTASRGTKA